MVTYTGRYTASQSVVSPNVSSVSFGADVSQAPVYLNVEVLPGQSFARLMLALGRVVRMRDTAETKDHSAYQAWVQGQYLKELDSEMIRNAQRVTTLLEKRKQLDKQVDSLRKYLKPYKRLSLPMRPISRGPGVAFGIGYTPTIAKLGSCSIRL